MKGQVTAETLADMAVEAHLAQRELDDIAHLAWALFIQTLHASDKAKHLEHAAAAVGLSPVVAQRVVGEHQRHAELLGKAHSLLKALIPHAEEIADILTRASIGHNSGRAA